MSVHIFCLTRIYKCTAVILRKKTGRWKPEFFLNCRKNNWFIVLSENENIYAFYLCRFTRKITLMHGQRTGLIHTCYQYPQSIRSLSDIQPSSAFSKGSCRPWTFWMTGRFRTFFMYYEQFQVTAGLCPPGYQGKSEIPLWFERGSFQGSLKPLPYEFHCEGFAWPFIYHAPPASGRTKWKERFTSALCFG